MAKQRIHIIGSGGGARGALHPRIYTALDDEYEIVGEDGSSISAVQALAVTTGNADELEGIWTEDIRRQGDFMKSTPLSPFNGLHNLKPLRRLLIEKAMAWGPPMMPLGVGVFWWESGTHTIPRIGKMKRERMIDYIIASSSILGIHDRYEVDGKLAGDGGHHSPLPVRRWTPRFKAGIDEVHVLTCRPVGKGLPPLPRRDTDNVFEMLMRWQDYTTQKALEEDIERLRRRSRRTGIPVYVYAPHDWETTGPTFDSNAKRLRAQIERRLEHGEWMLANRVRL